MTRLGSEITSQDLLTFPKSETKTKQNSKPSLIMGTWNVRGLRSKIIEIEEYLEKKVNICALQ